MRLIDADALIQDMIDKKIPFNADVNEAILNAREIGGYADYVDRVWGIAYERGKEDAFQWIPCSERQPDLSDYYLVTEKGAMEPDFVTVGYCMETTNLDDKWFKETGYPMEATAWMPLPPSYRGDNHE